MAKIESDLARQGRGLGDAPPITIRRRRPTAGRRKTRRVALVLLLTGLCAPGAWYWKPLSEKVRVLVKGTKSTGIENIMTYTVKRGPLRISLTEEGKLRAVKNHDVVMSVNGKITWLAEAGAKVKKGDLLVTVDKTNYETQRARDIGELEAAKAALAVAEQAVPIAKSNGEAAQAAAGTKRDEAVLALKQYTTLEAPKKLSEFETQINDARAKLAEAQKKRGELQAQLDEILDDGPEKKTLEQQVSIQKQTVASLQRVQATGEDQRKLFRAYNYPQDIKSKQQALANAELEVNKAQVSAKSEVLQKEAEVREKNQLMIERTTTEIKNLDDQISKCSVNAPVNGLVFYGGAEEARYGGDMSERIRVGLEWYSQGPIMNIPDLSAFQVDVPIAEVYRGRITPGMPTTVTLSAIPGLVLDGSVNTLATVARNRISWDSTSPQVFDATISMHDADPRMVAGMSVKVEIVTALLVDVTFVPVEAVFNENGKTAAFMWVEPTPSAEGHVEIRPVLTGEANDHFVEIKKGLKEGDKLLLSRPTNFVTPADYRELVDAMFPAVATRAATRPDATLPATASAPATSPAAESQPALVPAPTPAR